MNNVKKTNYTVGGWATSADLSKGRKGLRFEMKMEQEGEGTIPLIQLFKSCLVATLHQLVQGVEVEEDESAD